MHTCMTAPLLNGKTSGCLVENPQCSHAYKIGFSYLCLHPEHHEFNAHKMDALTISEALVKYDTLRQRRRNEFASTLDNHFRDSFQSIME